MKKNNAKRYVVCHMGISGSIIIDQKYTDVFLALKLLEALQGRQTNIKYYLYIENMNEEG